MGWASGGDIFNRVTHTLLKQDFVPDEAVTAVCADLIDALRDGDWDALGESVEEFRDVPAVMEAFRQSAPEYVEDADG